MRLSRRAEKADPSTLVQTFVNVGPLFDLLSIIDNQIIFGRRGTGKTHALQYLTETVKAGGNITSYSDLSNLGSSGGIYSDPAIPLSERATRLLIDALSDIHENILRTFVERADDYDLSQTGPLLDSLAEAITSVRVVGTVEEESSGKVSHAERSSLGWGAEVSSPGSKASASFSASQEKVLEASGKRKTVGVEKHTVHFGAVRRVLEQITNIIRPHRLWLVFDEWSSVPLELQPYLADLLRRSVFPVRNITVKIAAIEYRTRLQLQTTPGDYIGIEIGADASADVNLDDFMVFDNDQERARSFFKSLFHKHLLATELLAGTSAAEFSPAQMLAASFTQVPAFDELVRAAEGVPRDAIHIASLAAQYAQSEKISVPHVRRAAKNWYQTGKEAAVQSRESAMTLLHWIVDKVIGERRARAFMLRSNVRHPFIEDLFDARVLHVLKRGVSTHDEPGARYDAYKLDYGCYIDLVSTSRAPQGLFEVANQSDDVGFVEVPMDDYRSIRRAILDIDVFDRSRLS
jgi:hypothetical protein